MKPFTRITMPELLLAQMIGHARSATPNECCGLIAGVISDGVGVAKERFGVRNDADSPSAFWTNAEDMLSAFRQMRAENLELLAVYHSHPSGGPTPSKRDVDENTYGESVVHLIVGLTDRPAQVRGWWLGGGESRPVTISTT